MTPADVYACSPEVVELIGRLAGANVGGSRRAAFEDCYQDGWQAALECARSYKPEIAPFDHFLTRWVYTRLVRKFNENRTNCVNKTYELPAFYHDDDVDHNAIADRILSRLEQFLPSQRRLLALLYPIDGSFPLTITEAARKLGKPTSNVCHCLNRIRDRAA